MGTIQDHTSIARSFEILLDQSSGEAAAAAADDILLFLYRLRDGYRIVRAARPAFSGRRFVFLEPLIYALESDPEAAFRSEEHLQTMKALFTDLANGALVIVPLS